jgi:hypothetical protein
MPRPSTTDSTDTSQDIQQQRLNLTPNSSLTLNNDITNSNSSSDYLPQSSQLLQQNSLSSTQSDDNSSNIFSLSMQEQNNDTTTSSSNSIPISRCNTIELNNNSNQLITTPNLSPVQSLQSTPGPVMEDKSIQCLNDEDEYEDDENSREQEDIEIKKRSGEDDSWTIEADR